MSFLPSRIAILTACALASAACNRGGQTKDDVRKSVVEYLATRSNLNLSSMDVEVASVAFRENQADAVVTFRAKGPNPGPGMNITYSLERSGSKWVVKPKAEGGGSPHGGAPPPAGAMPPGHPAIGGAKTP